LGLAPAEATIERMLIATKTLVRFMRWRVA